MSILLKFWKESLLAVVILFISVVGYNKIYSLAEKRVSSRYDAQILEQTKILEAKIQELQEFSKVIVVQNEIAAKTAKEDILSIKKISEKSPLVIVENGKCRASEEFLDSYDSIIRRGNSK